jgi:hypothetical protein
MLYDQGGLGRFEKKQSRKPGGSGQAADKRPDKRGRFQDRKAAEKPPAGEAARNDVPRHPPLPDDESKRLFISIGRNRRLFPREILGLINAKTTVSREDIGAIRILDNYSFIQVRDSVADTIIEALNGQSFRGRTLAVNYARARKDDGGESREPDFSELPGGQESTEPTEPDEADGFFSGQEAGNPEDDGFEESGDEQAGSGEPPEMEMSEQDDDHADEEAIEDDSRQ